MKFYLFTETTPEFFGEDAEGNPIGIGSEGAEEPLDLSGIVTSVDFGRPDPGAAA